MWYATIVVLAFLAPSSALACTCSHPSAADESEVSRDADIVFIGEVAGVTKTISNGIEIISARFKVLKTKKGDKSGFITIHVSHGGTSCDLMRSDFQLGERYLISGTEIRWADPKLAAAAGEDVKTKRYNNNFCDLRERLDVTPNTSLQRTREG